MRFAIIAAGEGSRLAAEGVASPKPLVRVGGEALIDRLCRVFAQAGAEEICVIVNRLHPETEAHMRTLQQASAQAGLPPVRLVAQTTPSSMHSFAALSPLLEGAPFCLTTVDTIFRTEEFLPYVQAFQRDADLDGLMAVTDYVDDEKPLWVGTDAELRITGFHDRQEPGDRYISGGIYCLRPAALRTLERCIAQGQSRMRNLQRALVADGLRLRAWPMSKILDVDHKTDIAKAEAFLSV